ncbi:MAG: response regulator [Planctomycetes bacterium]|nr:response regulator [Planctomycetota bacterium]
MTDEPRVILLAEDDEGHANLVRRHFQRAGIAYPLVHVGDGQEALDWVRGEGAYQGRPPGEPALLLLDLKMPRVDGLEVLRQLKADPRTNRIPVVVLTTTDGPREIDRCYELGCHLCLTKPLEPEHYVAALRRVGLVLPTATWPRGKP